MQHVHASSFDWTRMRGSHVRQISENYASERSAVSAHAALAACNFYALGRS
jgi:hypothetical protein